VAALARKGNKVTCRAIYCLDVTGTCAAALEGVTKPAVDKQREEVCVCICQSFPRIGLSCSWCGVVHGLEGTCRDRTPRAGLNMGRPVPQKPRSAVRGREPIDAAPIRDRTGLRRWLNRCKEPACCSSRTWGRKRNRRPPHCCFPSVLHTPTHPPKQSRASSHVL
jgi:hypothetical protein